MNNFIHLHTVAIPGRSFTFSEPFALVAGTLPACPIVPHAAVSAPLLEVSAVNLVASSDILAVVSGGLLGVPYVSALAPAGTLVTALDFQGAPRTMVVLTDSGLPPVAVAVNLLPADVALVMPYPVQVYDQVTELTTWTIDAFFPEFAARFQAIYNAFVSPPIYTAGDKIGDLLALEYKVISVFWGVQP